MDLSQLVLETVESSHTPEIRRYIGCSSIGHPCNRYLWYAYHSAPGQEESTELLLSFEIGKRLEDMILSYIEETGIQIIRPNKFNHGLLCRDNEIPEFQGHMDAIITISGQECVLEIKTAKSTSFQNFVKKGLQQWSSQYYAQLQSYMGMKNYTKGALLAINKDTSELHHEWVDFDHYYYNELREKARNIYLSEEPPNRINKNETYYLCARCKYRKTCFNQSVGG